MSCSTQLRAVKGWDEVELSESPWRQLYSVKRDGVTELSISGIVAVSDGQSNELLIEKGDVDYVLWTRSLLKPFQLASHLEILQKSYSALKPEHYALMSSSHNCEDIHLKLLGEVMEIGRVSPSQLRCPASWPGDVCTRERFKSEGKSESPLYHNCSGKHLSYLMSLQAQNKPPENYIDFDNAEHSRLEALLARNLHRPVESFLKTTDGCQLPNFAISLREMASLYQMLAFAAGSTDAKLNAGISEVDNSARDLKDFATIGRVMNEFPIVLGGSHRLDSKIMQHGGTAGDGSKFIAKDGADGLLAVGLFPSERFVNGLGIVIKLASGYDIRHMETILNFILEGLKIKWPDGPGSKVEAVGLRSDHIKAEFYLPIGNGNRSAGGNT